MFLYKKPLIIAVIVASGLQACKPGVASIDAQYFDLKGYFTGEIGRLSKTHPIVSKSVSHNDTAQSKSIRISDWESELALFTGSDINKPAWRDGYSITETPDSIIYKALKPELKVRELSIKRRSNKVTAIVILNKTKNILYNSTEKLAYYPDSLYSIEKKQDVSLIGINHYKIQGKF
ncbi:MAG: hypothetical protein EOP46_01420 [Sphingobacteriaceae bacterium]|nr:MAG: hypothetical protein EOP46_01420 [Sphingobacteriaceae bacterium]